MQCAPHLPSLSSAGQQASHFPLFSQALRFSQFYIFLCIIFLSFATSALYLSRESSLSLAIPRVFSRSSCSDRKMNILEHLPIFLFVFFHVLVILNIYLFSVSFFLFLWLFFPFSALPLLNLTRPLAIS